MSEPTWEVTIDLDADAGDPLEALAELLVHSAWRRLEDVRRRQDKALAGTGCAPESPNDNERLQ